MPPLPQVSGREAVAAFERAGFVVSRTRVSHIVLVKVGWPQTLSVPDHRRLRPGTLRALMRQAGLDVAAFVELLR